MTGEVGSRTEAVQKPNQADEAPGEGSGGRRDEAQAPNKEEERKQEQEREREGDERGRREAASYVAGFEDLPRGARRGVGEHRTTYAGQYYEQVVVEGKERDALSNPLTPAYIEELTATYVKPTQYRRAQRVFEEHRVVVLVGRSHLGKRTSALCLADSAPTDRVERFDPATTLSQLDEHVFDRDSAYIAENLLLPPSDAQVLSHLDRLSRRLGEGQQDSYFVLTADREYRAFDEDLRRYLVDWSQLPDPGRMLNRHVEQRLCEPDRPLRDPLKARERLRELLDSSEVRQARNEVKEPREIKELADLLVQEADGQIADGEALRRHSTTALGHIASKFQTAYLREQCAMVALAVLDGSSLDTVLQAADRLRDRIRPDRRERGTPPTSLNTERMRRSTLLETIGAEPVWDFEHRPFGRHPVRIMRLRSDGDRERILQHVWEEHDELHGALLGWLGELVKDDRAAVHRSAALALGTLALHDFAGILRLLESWAEEAGDPHKRGAVAMALGEPAADERYREQVLAVLAEWSRVGSPARRWTAAAAYGGYVGFLYPSEALAGLRRIAETGNPTLRWVLNRGVASLMETGDWFAELHSMVLEALLGWTDDDAPGPVRRQGRLVFVELASLTGLRGAVENGPRLLLLARDDAAHRDRVATLWLRALAWSGSRSQALERLRAWFGAADEERLRQAMQALVAQMAALTREDEDGRARLRYHVGRWASAAGRSSTAAESLSLLD
jgi:hypothetical protein